MGPVNGDVPKDAPWWVQLAWRHGPTAAMAFVLLYYVGDLLKTLPQAMERQGEKITAAIKESAHAQIQAVEVADRRADERERRADERTRNAVKEVIGEVHKERSK